MWTWLLVGMALGAVIAQAPWIAYLNSGHPPRPFSADDGGGPS